MRVRALLLLLTLLGALPVAARATSRIKDVADFEGVRENVLIGYGLVVGLNGSGDSLRNSVFTQESLVAMLERLGVGTRGVNLNTRNVAAVMVTATLPPFARQGTRIDVAVNAMGDAKSLLGGTLLATPLLGADGEVYAVAQGALAVGGFEARGAAQSVTRNVPTSARLPAGAIVEREVPFALDSLPEIRLALRNPDFTTAQRIATVINSRIPGEPARATDPATVRLPVPAAWRGRVAQLLSEIEQLPVQPDSPARIVIDEASGIIVMGDKVRISRVAVAQGNLTVRVTETPQVSQPNPLASGETVVVPRTNVEVDDQRERRMVVLEPGATLDALVDGLNALGVGPRDMIAIIQAIKAAGALQAEIEVM
ncbi:MAG: flagellar basal body P-ring protein FlgI [Geminicoccaceae bacterium]|nr:flagellar basal body P-ring protein FlgI [Geminicoccaceae bacterium]MDW8369607.1 flagellar basal body P-ring protein FlgI [Geminicoccaceae bacterium]